MIDLHCHILPGVDDGSSSEEESCRMARLAVESGVTAVCATPHCNVPGCFDNYRTEALEERFLCLARLLGERDIPLRLYAGMEVYVTPETPRHLREGKLLTLGGSRYLLVEFGFEAPFSFAQRMLEEMEARNERFTLKELALSGNDLNMIGIRGKAAGDTLKLLKLGHVVKLFHDDHWIHLHL